MTGPGSEYAGTYRQCPVCEAPIVSPFPGDWHLDLIKEGPKAGPVTSWMTPHTPDCTTRDPQPDPGLAVRLSGNYVVALHVTPPPVPADLTPPVALVGGAGRLYVAPVGTQPDTFDLNDGTWTLLGPTDGVAWSDPE